MKKSSAVLIFGVLAVFLVLIDSSLRAQEDSGGRSGATDLRIGIIYMDQEPRITSQSVTTIGYGEIFSGLWKESGEKNGFTVVEVASSVGGPQPGTAELSVLREGRIDALVVYLLNPSASASAVKELPELGVPMIVSGESPSGELDVPFVGFDGYGDGFSLGKETGRELLSLNRGDEARILVAGSVNSELSEERVRGFLEGIRSIVSDARIIEEVESIGGDVSESLRTVQSMLVKYPGVNVIFGVDEIPTLSILGALASSPEEEGESRNIVTAGFGSSGAVLGAGGGNDSVDVVALLPFREMVEKSVSILKNMLDSRGSGEAGGEYLIKSEIVVGPTGRTMENYLEKTRETDSGGR